jgi:4-azaleucine resistance transporter AzlC
MSAPEHASSTRAEVLAGLRAIWPIAVSAIPIGGLAGALAVAKGLSVAEATLMSVIVFAGGAQFAAIELWAWPIPVATLVFSTLLINSRHVLMGASLSVKLRGFSFARRFFGFFFLTDEAWALAEMRGLRRPVTPAFWFGVALPLAVVWFASTVLGAVLGTFLGDPSRFGADFAFSALFIGLIVGFWRAQLTGLATVVARWASVRTLVTIGASLAASAIVYLAAGPPWHVAAGAFAGIVAAYATAPPAERGE